MKARFIYDPSKRMWSKHASTCCGAVLEQKMLYQGKVTKPGFKLATSTKVPVKVTAYRKWWQVWKPKRWEVVTDYKIVTTYKEVQFRYFCSECDKQDEGSWEFVHEDSLPKLNPNKGVSEGQRLVSKTERASSSLATPAKDGKNSKT